jgi:hypothetical protein
MKLKRSCIIFMILLLAPAKYVNCQKTGEEEILMGLFDGIIDTRDNERRIMLNDSIISIIDSYAESDSVLNHRFDNLRYLGQILSPDSKVKIITWNLLLTDGTNKYFCYIIRKGKKRDSNKVYKLTGKNMDDPPEINKTYSAEDWYGALYYAIQPFRISRETFYILLGLDNTNLTVSTKIIDVVTFTDENGIIFGKDCFTNGDKATYRHLLSYAADGIATLRFENRKTIIFDHLVSASNVRPEQRGLYVPEFSFDAYVLKKGDWKFEENVQPRIRK